MDVPPKTRIDTLSDLIFGLALSIGALTLIGQPPNDFKGLVLSIAYYGFSFIIIISVWSGYTRTMTFLHAETGELLSLNVAMLFLVSIEPFLFNHMIHSSMSLVEDISIAYAFDLGGLFAVTSLLSNFISMDTNKPEQIRSHFRKRRNTSLIIMSLFFISAIPVFWSWEFHVTSGNGVPLRFIIWMIPLFLAMVRRIWGKREKL